MKRVALLLLLCGYTACTSMAYVPHGSGDLPIYPGSAPVRGQEYRSLGAIKVTRGTVGVAFLWFDLDRVAVDARDIYVESQDAGQDMADF